MGPRTARSGRWQHENLHLKEPMRSLIHVAVALSAAAFSTTVQCQQQLPLPNAPGYTIETHRLPPSATFTIKELPPEVDMELAKKFVTIGFGPLVLGKQGFQSTQFLTPTLSTRQAAELVKLVPEYGRFRGMLVAEALLRFSHRVSGVQFGREGSPVLYIDLPYWTHQQEGPIAKGAGVRISEDDHQKLVQELQQVFVGKLLAKEFSTDPIRTRTIRIWWHH